ncbi:MAG TPA: hypothetical protein PLS90_14105 [Candidatus Sumerlaeota bacterium]|nr:hypothetical protein [Candidatus Sumerlaeota bacterium]HPK03577.1 hypothetical protein [Candidatus Sumerlaeota bacterium]
MARMVRPGKIPVRIEIDVGCKGGRMRPVEPVRPVELVAPIEIIEIALEHCGRRMLVTSTLRDGEFKIRRYRCPVCGYTCKRAM